MKNSLEYNILKHLSKLKNGEFIDISEIESNKTLLKSVIKDLKENKYIETKPYPSIPWKDSSFMGSSPSEKPEKCKILFLGETYLESLKPNPIPKDRILYLILFIIFSCIGAFGTYKTIFKDVPRHKYDSLKNKYDSIIKLKSSPKLKKSDSTYVSKKNH